MVRPRRDNYKAVLRVTPWCAVHTRPGLAALLFTLLFTLAAGNALGNSSSGAWQSPVENNWPLIPIHAVLTPDGRVLTYGTDGDGNQTGYFIYDVWDPSQGLSEGHLTLPNMTLTDLFCSSSIVLPQSGSVLISGGDNWGAADTKGNRNTNLYANETLTRGVNMYRPRWYGTSTVLPNGEVYIQGGTGGTDRPEVRSLDGTFRLLTGANTSPLHHFYPRNFLMADGRLFGYDIKGNMSITDPAGVGARSSLGQFTSGYAGSNGSSALFRPGSILQLGGNSSAVMVIDFTSGAPVLTPTQSLSSLRKWVTATVLPDGQVLATGGSSRANALVGVNNAAEIWNPETGRWLVGASGGRARLYHSVALLLPDASVLVAGGGAPGPLDNRHAEIYYPPFLFSGDQLAARPSILDAPTQIELGETFPVEADSSAIQRVTLVRTGAVTHSYGADQMFLELAFSRNGGSLSVKAPVQATEAPPGYYMLFLFNSSGVPSVARIIQIGITDRDTIPPSIPAGLTVSEVSDTSVALSWAASRDSGGSGLENYRVYRDPDATPVGEPVSTAFNNTALAPLNSYAYRVSAIDAAGNESAPSAAVSATTSNPASNESLNLTLPTAQLTQVNLTDLGTSDWVHWGLSTAGSVNRKANVPLQISGLSRIGATLARFAHQPSAWTPHTWRDGTPVATRTGFAGGIRVGGLNKGYEISAPADTTDRRLYVFLGGQNTLSSIEASISGSGAPPVLRQIGNISGKYRHMLTISYRADSAGQRLRVRQVITAGTGQIRIQSASLQADSGPVNRPPEVTNPGTQNDILDVPAQLQIQATDPDNQVLVFSAEGLPSGITIDSATGMLSGTPSQPGITTATVSVTDGQRTASVVFTWTILAAAPLQLEPMPVQPAVRAGTTVSYTALVSGGVNPRFKWTFGDGTETAWIVSPSTTHVYDQAGLFWVTLAVTDDRNVQRTTTFQQFAHNALTPLSPAMSTSIVYASGKLWVVNPDNDSISAFSVTNHQRLAEVPVGTGPRSLAQSPGGDIWVVARDASTISVVDPATLSRTQTIPLPQGSLPYGLVFAPDGSAAFVALEATGEVLKLDPASGALLERGAVGGVARHLSVDATSDRLYVSRYITGKLPGEDSATVSTPTTVGGEVAVLDTASLTRISTIVLRHSNDLDSQNEGGGIPNYLGPAVISPDGTSAWVPSKKDNVKRGALRNALHLNHQNTVRAISSRVNLADDTETFSRRIDHDNASVASAAAFDRLGVLLFVALETSREVAVVDAHDAVELFRIDVGRAPQGVVVSPDGSRLYVNSFMDRTVTVHDLKPFMEDGQLQAPILATLDSVASEKLAPDVLLGKQLFYDAKDPRLAAEGYMSCASCHNDGGHDGRVWDMTGFGEGLRKTIDLRGRRGAHGRIHWSGNADEVHDLETQIRNLAGGTGLMTNAELYTGTRVQALGDPKAGASVSLDALAAYVVSLDQYSRSPYRLPGGAHSAEAIAGRAVFQDFNCAQCHGGDDFTNSLDTLVDIGTIRQPGSGSRSGEMLTGIDTPTLRGLWLTAHYLHDGSAENLGEAVRAHGGVTISNTELDALVAYLMEIDGLEPAP